VLDTHFQVACSWSKIGIEPLKPSSTTIEADKDEYDTVRGQFKKRQEMDATVVCIDQPKKSVQYVTAANVRHFILALCKDFENNLIVMLGGEPYFQA
jgi:hypothetical protein